MTATNAAIWYATDGYDPVKKGINGRRVARESFLRGFFAHGEVDEFVSIAHAQSDHAAFADLAHASGLTPLPPPRSVALAAPVNFRAPLAYFLPVRISSGRCSPTRRPTIAMPDRAVH